MHMWLNCTCTYKTYIYMYIDQYDADKPCHDPWSESEWIQTRMQILLFSPFFYFCNFSLVCQKYQKGFANIIQSNKYPIRYDYNYIISIISNQWIIYLFIVSKLKSKSTQFRVLDFDCLTPINYSIITFSYIIMRGQGNKEPCLSRQ